MRVSIAGLVDVTCDLEVTSYDRSIILCFSDRPVYTDGGANVRLHVVGVHADQIRRTYSDADHNRPRSQMGRCVVDR